MTPIIISTAYLPPISWLSAVILSENILIEAHETYPKQTYRNRCKIATSTGELNLTVPVKKINGNHTITSDIKIDNATNWKRLHWRSITTSYNKTPYFLYYRDLFESVFAREHISLLELNKELLSIILKILKIDTVQINYTETYDAIPAFADMRNCFHPKESNFMYRSLRENRYIQVFEESVGFLPDLSCIDLIFNLGPEANSYLKELQPKLSQAE